MRYDSPIHMLLDDRFKFCPACLRSAYHSFFYQLRSLILCPIHGCNLRNTCEVCGIAMPLYRWHRSLLEQPYACSRCLQPVAGRFPDLDSCLVFQSRRSVLEAPFAAITSWAKRIEAQTPSWERFDWSISMHGYGGRFAQDMQDAYVRSKGPVPLELSMPTNLRVLLLHWDLALCPPKELGPRKWDGTNVQQNAINAVYRATLRKLQQHLLRLHQESLVKNVEEAAFDPQGHVITQGRELHSLAYILLRIWLEQGASKVTLSGDVKSAYLAVLPRVGHLRARSLRLPLRGAFLAAYATLLVTLQTWPAGKPFPLRSLPSDFNLALCTTFHDDFLRHRGLVLIPSLFADSDAGHKKRNADGAAD